jgi:ketosteroid isomerase-like protein
MTVGGTLNPPGQVRMMSGKPQGRRKTSQLTQGGGTMRRIVMASVAVGLMAAFFPVVEPAGQTGEQELRMLIPKIVASWESMDTAKIEPYYAADADLTYFDLVPMKYNNWAEYRVGVKKALFDPNRSIKLKMNDDLRVHTRGRLAWATFTFGADIVNQQGAASHLDGRWTMVLEKRASGWIVVHEHVSAPLGGA